MVNKVYLKGVEVRPDCFELNNTLAIVIGRCSVTIEFSEKDLKELTIKEIIDRKVRASLSMLLDKHKRELLKG